MSIARLAARGIVGGLLVGHGLQKLTGCFDGPGLDGTQEMMEGLQMHPARIQAVAAGATEAVAGSMLAAGFLTPVASAGIVGVMTTAIRKVHAANGVWNSKGGWEYNAVVIAAALVLAESPGRFSLDAAFGRRTWGTRWVLGALTLGVLASAASVKAGEYFAPDDPAPSVEEA